MAAKTSAAPTAAAESASDEIAAKVVNKRFEGLVMVRTKAIKGKGAWYWAHLEPILVHNSDTGFPRAVKLRCSLCDAVFSASNPSRTASEHLKRGTCPNFTVVPQPFSSFPQTAGVSPPPQPNNHRKRSVSGGRRGGNVGSTSKSGIPTSFPAQPMTIVDPSRFTVNLPYSPAFSISNTSIAVASASTSPGGLYNRHHQNQQLVLSGGKDDLGALAMLEDSVKRLKTPKASLGTTLNKDQIDAALDVLADWAYECCGSVPFSTLEHPKFKAFLNQVGLPFITKRELMSSRLDTKYEEAKLESEAKIREAMFFQISAQWSEESFVRLTLNLPNGTTVFRQAVITGGNGYVPPKYAEEIFQDTIRDICGNSLDRCVGIVSDKFKSTALRNLENQHPSMVNICCQYRAFNSLIKDLWKNLPLFKNAAQNSFKLSNFINNKSRQIRHCFHKYQLQEYGHTGLLRVPLCGFEKSSDFGPMVEDILSSARALQLLVIDDSYKVSSAEDPVAREVEELTRNPCFWKELEAVDSLVKLIKSMAKEIEREKPRAGQCLPLWEDLRVKIKDWCCKFQVGVSAVEKIIEGRFEKNYHPSWAAAFVLDPIYLIRETSGKYLPPFKLLTPEQEKDVDVLITRLVSREEAHVVLMELMKWRTQGLDPVYAQAVQLKERDLNTGKMKIVNPQSSRLVWETHLTELKSLGRVAVRLIFLRATSCGVKCRLAGANPRSREHKLMFVSAHYKDEFFGLENDEDDVVNEVFVETSSV